MIHCVRSLHYIVVNVDQLKFMHYYIFFCIILEETWGRLAFWKFILRFTFYRSIYYLIS